MMKPAMLALLLALPCAGCATGKLTPTPVRDSAGARTRVAFCDVAEPMPSIDGDPLRTQQQKAAHNGTGGYLCGWPGKK
ncbi:hypothetical protein [Microvirga antarctica]|uniref:hypothetical protein n=1 Tax=Microvirga antarctica TaxID=2819233 RepID=UPI001B315EC4|nr:hypothetical protein [Microvirga antarctica]